MQFKTVVFGQNLIRLEKTESTNSVAAELLEANPPEGTLIITDQQTAGRGLGSNSWISQPGSNLTFSIILRPTFINPSEIFYLNKVIAIAIAEAVKQVLPKEDVKIKWPNDILVDDRKVAGVLIRNQMDPGAIRSSIVGIGLNVNQIEFDESLQGKATSLRTLKGEELDLSSSLDLVLQLLEASYFRLRSRKIYEIDTRYADLLWKKGEETSIRFDGENRMAIIEGVEKDGRLRLQLEDKTVTVNMKEVQFLLP